MKFKMKGIFGEDGKIHPVEDGDDWILDVDDYGPLMVKEKKPIKNPEEEFIKYVKWFGSFHKGDKND